MDVIRQEQAGRMKLFLEQCQRYPVLINQGEGESESEP